MYINLNFWVTLHKCGAYITPGAHLYNVNVQVLITNFLIMQLIPGGNNYELAGAPMPRRPIRN